MTDEILQADIDLTRRLLQEGASDDQIVQNLACRHVAPNRAARLVTEIRRGALVEPDRDWAVPEQPSRRRRSERSSSGAADEASKGHRRGSSEFRVPWFRVLATVSIILCIAVVASVSHRKRQQDEGSPNAEPLASPAPGLTPLNPKSLAIQLGEDGLKVQGAKVSSDNAVAIFSTVLGPASRTNRVAALDKTVYVFDSYGVLVYPAKERNRDSIVIDFEGNGGTNGANMAFTGTLTIGDSFINADANPKTLMEAVGSREHESGSGIYNLTYKDLHVIFGYLTRIDRLSLVEIDFDSAWGNPLH